MKKWLLFTSGGGSSDPLNWDSSEAGLYSSEDLKTIKPGGPRSLDLIFETGDSNKEVVTLKIKNKSHSRVISSIANAIEKSNQSIISIADLDSNRFINKDVYGVSIKTQETYIQTLTNNSRTKLNTTRNRYSSCLIANIDGTDAVACTLELYDGTTYTKLLDQISIPAKNTLKLEKDEISFDFSTYDLYATSGDSGGQLTFTFNY